MDFLLETSLWWGGFYERMVRSIKNTLKKKVGVSLLDYEQLNTVLAEIENVIHSRQLTYMNDENTDESLTPYHLIYGRNIATNKVSLLKMATYGESLRLNCKKINIVWNILQNDLLINVYLYYTSVIHIVQGKRRISSKDEMAQGKYCETDSWNW